VLELQIERFCNAKQPALFGTFVPAHSWIRNDGVTQSYFFEKTCLLLPGLEADGDIHVMLRDATGNKIGMIGAKIPVGSTRTSVSSEKANGRIPFGIRPLNC
jgi:hypothetical protein